LQGLLRLEEPQRVYVLDSSSASLAVSKERASEIEHTAELFFLNTWEKLPLTFDLAIIATGANVRAAVTKRLLDGYKVNNLVLEKILFQDIESYQIIGNLIKETHTPTWVNHPRRMFKHYQHIKEFIALANEPIIFTVAGGNWGLACNTLHFMDLCSFLSGRLVTAVCMESVDPVIIESKRVNNIEFTGSVKGTLGNNSSFMITSFDGSISDVSILVASRSQRWLIHEGKSPSVNYFSELTGFKQEVYEFKNEFQSTLTTRLAQDIFVTGLCSLPTYDEACASHVPFIKAAINKYNEIIGAKTLSCPIT